MLGRSSKIITSFIIVLILFSIIYSFQHLTNTYKPPHHTLQQQNASSLPSSSPSYFSYPSIPVGLPNLKNVCYMSSILQILFMILPKWIQNNNGNSIITQKFMSLAEKRDISTYQEFKRYLQKQIEIVNGYQQQDSHQFFVQFIQVLAKQNPFINQMQKNRKNILPWHRNKNINANNELQHLFTGQLLTTYTCQNNHITSQTKQPFFYLSVALPQIATISIPQLSQLINNYFLPQQISQAKCDKCTLQLPNNDNKNNNLKVKLVKTTKIIKAPHYLVVQLLRFKKFYDGSVGKNNQIISYGNNIMIEVQDEEEEGDGKYKRGAIKQVQYKLVGTVNHWGSLNHGHYYAQVRNLYRNDQNKMYRVNDLRVQQIQFRKNQIKQSQTVYLMFYQKISL